MNELALAQTLRRSGLGFCLAMALVGRLLAARILQQMHDTFNRRVERAVDRAATGRRVSTAAQGKRKLADAKARLGSKTTFYRRLPGYAYFFGEDGTDVSLDNS